MKNNSIFSTLTLFLLLTFLNFQSFSQAETVELPIQEAIGFGDFQPVFGFMSMDLQEYKALWGKVEVVDLEIPRGWEKSQNTQILVDFNQVVYQSYKRNEIDSDEFDAWEIDVSARQFSETPIKCFVNVLIKNDSEGTFVYMVDTDNDYEFSDEKEMKPFNIENDSTIRDSEEFMQQVDFQIFRDGKLIESKISIIVAEMGGKPVSAISQHFKSVFLGESLQINHGFSDISFSEEAPIKSETNAETTEIGEILNLSGSFYKNLGVDFDKQVLRLQKISDSTILYSSQVGFMAKPFEGTDFVNGDSIQLENYRGKLLYLDFWGSWCKPCVEELPELKELYGKLDHSKVEFLGIASDSKNSLSKAMSKHGINWSQILDEDNSISKLYNINSYPTTLLIDENGKVIAKDIWAKDLEKFLGTK
jgi:peroxiredoxin